MVWCDIHHGKMWQISWTWQCWLVMCCSDGSPGWGPDCLHMSGDLEGSVLPAHNGQDAQRHQGNSSVQVVQSHRSVLCWTLSSVMFPKQHWGDFLGNVSDAGSSTMIHWLVQSQPVQIFSLQAVKAVDTINRSWLPFVALVWSICRDSIINLLQSW